MMAPSMDPRITHILNAADAGDTSVSDELLPLVYDELRRLAAARLGHERQGHSLQATALVHEAYVRLTQDSPDLRWTGRGHFFGAAAEAMRRILVDRARARKAAKRGGDRKHLRLELADLALNDVPAELLDLDASLTRLAAIEPVKAELIKLRFFAGLTMDQAADALGISPSTADRHWSFARAWLYRDMTREASQPGG